MIRLRLEEVQALAEAALRRAGASALQAGGAIHP
jgi:hypothetical protein